MRSTKYLLPVFLLLALAQAASAQANLKIGYIDSQAILDQDPSAQAAQQQFEASLATYQAEVQQLSEDLQTLISQYEQQQAMLSEEAKANREEEIRIKQTQYQQRIAELEQQAGARQAELVEPVMQRITAVIEEIREEGSYSMIFDVAAQGIISADPALDLTAEVVQRLQAAASQANTGGSNLR
jgi:outer membrane protein